MRNTIYNFLLGAILAILVMATSALAAGAAAAVPDYLGAEYVATTEITLGWDAVDGAERYEIVPVWVDPGTGPVEYPGVVTTDTTVVVPKPRSSGHFIFKLRACAGDLCSEWVTSDGMHPDTGQPVGLITDPDTGEEVPSKWRVYYKVAPPSGPIVSGGPP